MFEKRRWMYEEVEGPDKWTELGRMRNLGRVSCLILVRLK